MTLHLSTVRASLAEKWGYSDARLEAHDRGMNSRTWFVDADGRRYVAKAVPADAHRRFVSGLAVASLVQAAGIPAGAATPTLDGQSFVRLDGHTLALLSFVNGSPLTGSAESEQRVIGATLARAHRAVIGQNVPEADRFHWIDASAEHLGVREWIRPAVIAALAMWDSIPPETLTWGPVHTDPAPEAFLLDAATGECGLIDWDSGMVGPLMYDVASAVMYVGGPKEARPLIDAYLEDGVLHRSEVERTLEPMLRLRWAVQADYFARRISANDLTGIDGPHENERGLEDARIALTPEGTHERRRLRGAGAFEELGSPSEAKSDSG